MINPGMQKQFDLCDMHFDMRRLHLCTLLIEFCNTRTSMAVLDHRNGKIVMLKTYETGREQNEPENIFEKINADSIAKARYSNILISMVTDKYIAVPAAFYDGQNITELFKLGNKISEQEQLMVSSLKMPGIQVVYACTDEETEALRNYFPHAKIFAHIAVLIQIALQRFRYKTNPVLTVHVRDKSYDLVVVSHSKLQLCNTFDFKTPEDFLYYILFACEQLELNPERVELFLSGNIDNDSPEKKLLEKYIRQIDFLPRTLNHAFASEFDAINWWQFSTLFDLSLCES